MPERSLSIRVSVRDVEAARKRLLDLGEEGQRALLKIEAGAGPASRGLQQVQRSAGLLARGGLQKSWPPNGQRAALAGGHRRGHRRGAGLARSPQ